jgi:hypothetical protein
MGADADHKEWLALRVLGLPRDLAALRKTEFEVQLIPPFFLPYVFRSFFA